MYMWHGMIRFADPCHKIVAKNIARENAMNKLDNSRPFDIWIWSNKPEVKEACNFIDKKFLSTQKYLPKKKLRYHLRIILTDLFVVKQEDPTRYIAISRSKNSYRNLKRLKNLFLQYKYTIYILDVLKSHGYIEQHKGFNSERAKRQTRIKGTEKLFRLFRKYKSDSGTIIKRNIPVILRDKNKHEINYNSDNQQVKNIILNTNRINKMLSRHTIKLDPEILWDEIKKSNTNISNIELENKYRRVFNNGSFNEGGRFFSHWSQRIPSKYRQYITIDGEDTVELDYSCLHLSMLYAIERTQLPETDLYLLDGIPKTLRNVIKSAVNISINAPDKTKAIQALNKYRRDNEYKYSEDDNAQPENQPKVPSIDIIDKILKRHAPIQKYFCSSYGLKLQNFESNIAEKILLHFYRDGKCALCIHDSFITSSKDEDLLRQLMMNKFYETFKTYPRISKK